MGIKRVATCTELRMGLALMLSQESPIFLAPGADFVEDSFSTEEGWGGVVSGCFKCIAFIVVLYL